MAPSVLKEIWWFRSTIVLIAAPLILATILPLNEQMGLTKKACNCLYMLLVMAVYWCTEALPLAVTALIPLFLVPMLGIQTADQVARNYFSDLNVLFVGGLIVAVAIEHSHLHKRISISILKTVGTNPRLLLLGFMAPTYFMSMWISNTATTAMMVTIVQAVINQLRNQELSSLELDTVLVEEDKLQENGVEDSMTSKDDIIIREKESSVDNRATAVHKKWEGTCKSLSLCVAYSSACGGIATLTGTGPNLVLAENVKTFSRNYNDFDFGVDFASWMGYAVPLSLILFVFCWIWLQVIFIGCRDLNGGQTREERQLIQKVINAEYAKLGWISWKEVVTLVHFIFLAALWLTRNPGGAGGWGTLFMDDYVSDGTVVMLVAVSLFMCPAERPNFCCWRGGCGRYPIEEGKPEPRHGVITWHEVTHGVSWGIILLLGGGFALADAISKSGLSHFIGNGLNIFSDWPLWTTVMCLSAITAAVTEFTSNVAIATIFLPIVGNIAIEMGLSPLYLMLPVCISSSFAFMLPVATPPNALVFATGVLTIKDMATTGLAVNIAGIFLVTLATITWGSSMFHLTEFNYTSAIAANASFNATLTPSAVFNASLHF